MKKAAGHETKDIDLTTKKASLFNIFCHGQEVIKLPWQREFLSEVINTKPKIHTNPA
jgi:hypothetical protein